MTSGESFPVTHTEAEWRARLSPEQYDVMRAHGTEAPGSCALEHEKRPGVFACAGCDQPLFATRQKFSKRLRLAELLRSARRSHRHLGRPFPSHDPHRGALQPLRLASRPCVSRWPAADRPALLHQWRGADIFSGVTIGGALAHSTSDPSLPRSRGYGWAQGASFRRRDHAFRVVPNRRRRAR